MISVRPEYPKVKHLMDQLTMAYSTNRTILNYTSDNARQYYYLIPIFRVEKPIQFSFLHKKNKYKKKKYAENILI